MAAVCGGVSRRCGTIVSGARVTRPMPFTAEGCETGDLMGQHLREIPYVEMRHAPESKLRVGLLRGGCKVIELELWRCAVAISPDKSTVELFPRPGNQTNSQALGVGDARAAIGKARAAGKENERRPFRHPSVSASFPPSLSILEPSPVSTLVKLFGLFFPSFFHKDTREPSSVPLSFLLSLSPSSSLLPSQCR